MGKVVYTMNTSQGYQALVGEGISLKFTLSGVFLREEPISFGMLGTMQDVDIISLLYSNARVEVAVHINGNFSKKESTKTIAALTNLIGSQPNIKMIAMREGVVEQTPYGQYFYVFGKGTLPVETLNYL